MRGANILEKRIRGRMRRLTLGPYGPLTLDQARELAATHVGAIAQGADPAQVRQDRLHEPTFGNLTAQYLERHAPRKRSARDDQGMLTTHLAVFRTRKLTDLNRNDVARLHAQVGETAPYRANRMVALLRKMFNLARDWDLHAGEKRIPPRASRCFERKLAIGSCNRRNSRDCFRRSRRKRIPLSARWC